MANSNVTIFDAGGRPPAIFHGRQGMELNAAAQANVAASFPVISIKGRAFKIKFRGEEEMVMDPVQPQSPASGLEVVIVGISPHISKQYFAGAYVEGADKAPDCFSIKGDKPETGVRLKQNDLCATCQHNKWGSRVTASGGKGKVCQDSRRVAVVPAGDINSEDGPMLLRIPPVTLNSLAQYSSSLSRRGAPIESVVTRISFDYNVAYPLLTFTALRWLTDEQALAVVGPNGDDGVMSHPTIDRILYENTVVAASDTSAEPDEEPEEDASPPSTQAPPPPPQSDPAAQAAAQAAVQAAQEATRYAEQKEAERHAAAAARPRRTGAFGGAGAPTPPVAAQPPAAAETPAKAVPNGAVTSAPPNIQQAIDDLLNAPAAV